MVREIFGMKIHYIDEGEGEVFVVLHGWGASIPTMQPVVNALKGKGRIIAIDMPGFGESEEPPKPYTSEDYADVVWELLEELEVSRCSLIGHSFGGKVSIILSSRFPDKIHKVVLIDSAGIRSRRGLKYYFKVYSFKALRWLYKNLFFWVAKEERLKGFYEKFGSTDYQSAQGVMRQTLVKVVNEDLTDRLAQVKAPTLLFWGDQDEDTPLYMGKIMEEKIPDAGLVIAKGAGHYAYLDDYRLFRAVLHAFIK